jgi:glycosyltransferase involved in cell wall biosynthesis
MKLSVIIPTKNRGVVFDQTLLCALDSIQHLSAEIIVVNDSRTSRPQIEIDHTYVTLIDNPKSGVAAARNLGASVAKGEIIIFMDDDILISKEIIDYTIDFYKHHPNTCFNPDWCYPDNFVRQLKTKPFGRFMIDHNLISFKGWYNSEKWRDNELFSSDLVASFFLPITRELFLESGGYNEKFPYAGFEDYDFPVRLRKRGVRFFIDTRVCVVHNEVDRFDLRNWLNRQTRGAQTRRVAVELGYNELVIEYSTVKKVFLRTNLFFKSALILMANNFPNIVALDFLFFRIILLLQATSIYEGYHKK